MVPTVQSNILYMHRVRWPLFAKYDIPHKYGLAPYSTVNLNISTSDNVRLGAWFIVSDSYYQHTSKVKGRRPNRPLSLPELTTAMSRYPTVLFFHGNAADRAVAYRVSLYSQLSNRLGANVLVIDYRGFGNSDGTPTEAGLAKDAKAAWDWLVTYGASPSSILIMGHSLGASVATMLASELSSRGIRPRGVTLVAPFTDTQTIARTYTLGGVIPLFRPLSVFPYVLEMVVSLIAEMHDTKSRINSIQAPILLVHCRKDPTIPSAHSRDLFETLLDPLLPPLPPTPEGFARSKLPREHSKHLNEAIARRNQSRAGTVTESTIGGFASHVAEFDRGERGRGGKVKLVETLYGGHTNIVGASGVIDLIGEFFDIWRT
ncbi:Alpha/Beta hydrolase protein [Cantharellus anzutake]|uniref:Alpha/Beta hydrolase protein n=1 Tax=Cantharellus anzutake TaxID=1750568 RepID=UPI001903AE8F|nr:Alpha/Beta hydrolase protein [Cantharellus anzutake]KAF8327028.1 Alpha/Beta hydrolase protein [Cantharellus anzutake]